MQPSDFRVNETWLAYRINQAPMQIEGQDVDLYVLQDAASMFLFGNLFAPHGADYPDAEEIEKLMMSAHKKRDEWPVELFLPGSHLSDNSFAKIAQKHGICIRSVPESQMSFYIKDTQEAYEDFLPRNTGDA